MTKEKFGNKKCVIFDFDGVIADTDAGRFESLTIILSKYGIDLKSQNQVRDLNGISTRKFLYDNFITLSNAEINQIVTKRRQIFLSHLNKHLLVYPGAVDFLRDLRTAKFELILATSNDKQLIEKLIEYIKIEKIFYKILTREQTENKYSKTKDYRLVLQILKKQPNECVVIEDSLIGAKAAKRAGIFCIVFDRYDDENISKEANILVNEYDDLRKLFEI